MAQFSITGQLLDVKYLKSIINKNGDVAEDVISRVNKGGKSVRRYEQDTED